MLRLRSAIEHFTMGNPSSLQVPSHIGEIAALNLSHRIVRFVSLGVNNFVSYQRRQIACAVFLFELGGIRLLLLPVVFLDLAKPTGPLVMEYLHPCRYVGKRTCFYLFSEHATCFNCREITFCRAHCAELGLTCTM
jgi:hypothetical protein